MSAVATAEALESFSPSTGRRLGAVEQTAPGDVQRVVDEVAQVQPIWAQLLPRDRARYMVRAGQAILDDIDGIRDLIVAEQGKTRTEAYVMEIVPSVDALAWVAREGPELLADEALGSPQLFFKTKRPLVACEPLGVVGVIAPWNYPWSIPLGEVAIALMAGNGVVLKPSSLTCLIGQRIQQLLDRAGLPEGLVRTVHGEGVGQALVDSSVAKVFFTGSVRVGRGVGEASAQRMRRAVLELGGKDPMIVLADANLPNAVSGALWGGFANAGQTCSGIERVYVMREVADRFVAEVVAGARDLKPGDPADWATQVGPMTSRETFEGVCRLVDDAVSAGAQLHCGGPVEVDGLRGPFYAPAVLTGVTHEMRIMREEVFGPVLPIVVVESEREAIALANDSRFGLGASVWTGDRHKGDRIARELDAGMVWINDHMWSHGAAQTPWGGVKDSGLGRAHSRFGFEECVNVKLIAHEPSLVRDFWWHPYDETLGRALRAAAHLLYSRRDADRRRAWREGALPLARVAARTLRSAARR